MDTETADLKLLRFRLGDLLGAVPLAHAREVLPMATLTRPPRLSDTVEGLLNFGGQSYPVLRLDRVLGIAGFAPNVDHHLILTRALAAPCLLLVERVLGVDVVPAAELQLIPDFVTARACVRRQYPTADGPAHVIELDQLGLSADRALKVVA